MLRRTQTLLVCQILVIAFVALSAHAGNPTQPSFQADGGVALVTSATSHASGSQIASKQIVKCRPAIEQHLAARLFDRHSSSATSEHGLECALLEHPTKGWELGGDVFFARTKGKVRFSRGMTGGYYGLDDVDLNADMGLDDHGAMGSFMAMYKFKSKWALRYSVMPMMMMGSGQPGKSFVFGNSQYTTGQRVNIEWERLEQRLGLVYDAVHTHSSRISLFGDYVRINDRIKLMQMQMGMGGDVMDNDLNMAMAGLEFEKCLKSTRTKAVLSLACKASGAFLDDAVGGEAETALKYSIPMNNGRWGFVKGGYRYVTYKKKSDDARVFDMAMEGGFLQMGLVF
ncbi:hypothetical protein [Desulfomonile tiedjei]|uniref:Uncharacterized protein n=1 Tax=Desulfomonile tiedjei (strain ATCC 49306 / DSM 6799 / DCB-1) TaxID=706587 RepID=I4C5X5_DESTA|nr:hypothetical protein [Desulfomonile tiedjei]AFM24966.1 hypothetical protein Desti_2276 [Desulfomonile tiedjei DSM 6799]